MFKKRLKGLLAMVLAGSIATTALPMSASATFGGNISDGTITIVGNGPDPIATIAPSDITSGVFSSGYLSEHPDYLHANNMWAVTSYNESSSVDVNVTVSGDKLAGKLNEYKESNTPYSYTYIKYSHKYVVTTDNPTTTDTDTNNAPTATTFPVNVSSPSPLKSITGYTVWYGVMSGSSVYSSAVVRAGDVETEPADSISIPMSTFGGLYTSSAGHNEWDRFNNGVTLIQVDTEYKTLNIPVLNGLGEPEMKGENPYTLSVTGDCYDDLDNDGNFYYVGYTKQNGEVVLSDYNVNNQASAWTIIEGFAANDPNFDVNTLFFLRTVYVHVNKDSSEIGSFTSRDLLLAAKGGQKPAAYEYIEAADPNSFWRISQKFVLGKDLLEETETYLETPGVFGIYLTETTEIIVTGIEPVKDGSTKSYVRSPLYVENVPATISDHADVLEKTGWLAEGNKCDTSNWQLWGSKFDCGDVEAIVFSNKSALESTNGVNSIGIDQLNTLPTGTSPLIYFPQVAIAPAVTVTAPAFNAVPATANIPANDGYSVKSVKWFDGTTELAEDDKFDCEKQYTVKVTLKPDTGLSFTESTAVTINGVAPTEKTLNQDGTLTVSYTFAATDKESLTAAEVTVDAPVLDGTPDVTADVAAGANYTASAVTWTPADAPFKGAKQYTAAVKLTAKYGYKFTENTTAKVNGNAVTPVLNTDGTLSVSYTFAETDKEALSAAEVTVTAPVLGADPVAAAVIPEGANYTASAVTWSPADAPFKGAKQYTAAVKLTAKDGYKFTANTTAKLNGNTVTPVLNTDGTLSVSYTFAATEAEAVTAAEVTVTAPEYDKAPAAAAVLPEGANYTASAVTWSPAAENFKSEQYTATVKLTAKDGYKFTANTTAKLNGNAVTPVLNTDGTLTVSYTFDKLSAFPDANAELEKKNPVIQVPEGEKITKELLEKIKESGKAVELDFGDYSWIIGPDFGDGELNDIDLSITKVPEENWATVVNNVTGHMFRMQISIAHSGEFGFTAYLVVDLTEGMVGAPDGTYYANLYQVLDDKLEWNASSVMTKDENDKWSAKLKFEHASEWLITIDDEDKNPANETPDTPDPTPSRPTVSGPSTDSGTKNPAKTTKSVGWPNITNEIKGSTVGATIEITLNDDTTIPEDALKAAAEKRVKLVIDAGYGRKWTIDGANANGGAVNLTVSGANVDIPEAAYKNIPCTDSKQLKLNASALNFTAQLTVPVGKDSTGKNAGIFYYNEQTGKLVFQIVSVVDNDGNITFDVSRGGRYFIALGNEDYDPGILTGDANGDGVVNAQDASDILKNIVSGYPIDSKAADVNGDGKIGAADAMFIRQYIVGLITAFPAAEA